MKFRGYSIRFCDSVTSKILWVPNLATFIKDYEIMKLNTVRVVQTLSNQNLSNV